MAGVDQVLEVIRRAVSRVRGEEVHAVIAPAPRPGETVHRHELNMGDPETAEVVEVRFHPGEIPFPTEGPDVELVDQAG